MGARGSDGGTTREGGSGDVRELEWRKGGGKKG